MTATFIILYFLCGILTVLVMARIGYIRADDEVDVVFAVAIVFLWPFALAFAGLYYGMKSLIILGARKKRR